MMEPLDQVKRFLRLVVNVRNDMNDGIVNCEYERMLEKDWKNPQSEHDAARVAGALLTLYAAATSPIMLAYAKGDAARKRFTIDEYLEGLQLTRTACKKATVVAGEYLFDMR